MTERPIIFSAPMVRALLAGTKTQTRRLVKPQPDAVYDDEPYWYIGGYRAWPYTRCRDARHQAATPMRCPYGQPGNLLWVREAWMDLQGTGVEHRDHAGMLQRYAYAADTRPGSYGDEARKDYGLKWRPSIHMPRAASRITLRITDARVERLQDISAADAEAEGISYSARFRGHCIGEAQHFHSHDPRESYRSLWGELHGPGSWDANHWVWVLRFERVEACR